MTARLWVLGAADPEMVAIETILRNAGETVAYATAGGSRVHPGNAYKADGVSGRQLATADTQLVLVECDGPGIRQHATAGGVVAIDHHRPGDPGYGRQPAEFWLASSLGQTVQALGRSLGRLDGYEGNDHVGPWWPTSLEPLLVAAADHCLAAAYAGQCPGVDPEALMRWRAESRAAFQRRPVEAVLADVDAARQRLREAVCDPYDQQEGGYALSLADLRGEQIPELPEAAAREGIAFLASMRERDGREKVVLQAAPPDLVTRFLAGELVPGLKGEKYGDPQRGIAGWYV